MTSKVFYSWQSDLPNPTNRGFIEQALEGAAKAIRDDRSIQVEPVVDRDTLGVPGAPDIASTIFEKIEQSEVFVCDVSIINKDSPRPSPNPNVLLELGYAVRAIGWNRIIIVINTAYGGPELLPFDLRMRRALTYQMPADAEDRATERKRLQAMLVTAVRAILAGNVQTVGEVIRPKWPSTILDLDPTLKSLDTSVFKLVAEEAMRQGHGMLSADELLKRTQGSELSDTAVFDSLQTLQSRRYIEIGKVHNSSKLFHHVKITASGLEQYARTYVDEYDAIVKAVGRQIIDAGQVDSKNVAATVGQPILLVNHIITSFKDRNWLKVIESRTGDYNLHVYEPSPVLKRMLE